MYSFRKRSQMTAEEYAKYQANKYEAMLEATAVSEEDDETTNISTEDVSVEMPF